jgi:obg-like ATPase 1
MFLQIEKRLQRLKKGRAKTTEEKAALEAEEATLEIITTLLDEGKAARAAELTADQRESIAHLQLLTMKPLTYAANVAEDELASPMENKHVQALHKVAAAQNCEVVTISAQVEAELNQLDEEEATEYLESLGVSEGGLKSLVRATYDQLGLCTYFTTGEKETRAWTFHRGMSAPQCAGVIHTGDIRLPHLKRPQS